ncbi:SpoIIE family protein phosphatase [Geminocystis sp. NIES-3709]|uniref:SpoIIE family protein phosphatase n=1 Tax=Geminocystis sp. NIES-3709 TaxID=1617448 RepID=UPI001E4F0DA7|nr:SpoIIE family protein phosphatase [Geminocystis sp. NIES-3709]
MKLVKKNYPRTNLRTLLVWPFLCQILAILAIVTYLSYRSAKRALNEITTDLNSEIAYKIDNYLENYFIEGTALNQVNRNAVIIDPLLFQDLTLLGRYFISQYQWTNNIDKIAFADEKQGNYIEIIKKSSQDFELKILDRNESNSLLTYSVDSQGNIIKLLRRQDDSNFDSRQLFWYQNTLKNYQNQWLQPYKDISNQQLITFTSKKIYDEKNNFLGVLTNHRDLTDISSFLSQLKIGKTGFAFIIDRNGLLIADSLRNKYNNQDKDLRFFLTPAINNPNIDIRQIIEFLNSKNVFSEHDIKIQEFQLSTNKNNLLIKVVNISNNYGINWFAVVAIPESDFMTFIQENTKITISLSVIALIFAISSGVITSKLIIQPIIKLKTASQNISEGEFNQKVPLQGIEELDILAESFNHMSEMLKAFFDNLNTSLQDVSNLKYAIDQSAIVTLTDPGGKIIYCNEKLKEISGYSEQELIGEKTNKLKSGCHNKNFYDKMWSTISHGHVWRGEIKNKAKNDHYYWVDTTIVPLTDDRGKILQYLSIQTEITERKLLEKNLEKIVEIRTQELAKANQEISLLNTRLCSENILLSGKLKILHEMQQLILPKIEELKKIKSLDIAGYMEPMDELGGDYYDVLELDDVITIGIGDVTGHGLESGMLMVMIQAAICTLKQQGEKNPVTFLDTLNRAIYYNIQRMKSEKNLSLAIINYQNNQLCISGQHEEVILVRKGGKVELIDTIDLGLPIGLDYDITEFIDHILINLNSGDGIVLYTDGITEARNVDKVQYGIDRLCNVVSQNWHLDIESIKDIIINDVKKFIGLNKITDDITLLLLKQK